MKRNWYLVATKYDTGMFQEWASYFTDKITFYIALLILRRSMKATEEEIFVSLKPVIRSRRCPMINEPRIDLKLGDWLFFKYDID
jgi:hypothetical protein